MKKGLLSVLSLSMVAACVVKEEPRVTEPEVSHCVYLNNFSKQDECREYHGPAWTDEGARAECAEHEGAFAQGACAVQATLGICVIPVSYNKEIHVLGTGDDFSVCSTLNQVCETFARGKFKPSEACESRLDDPLPPLEDPNATLVCSEPLPGEPVGQSEGGKVCTWESITGCTEPGRNFADYASCESSYESRGYAPAPPPPESEADPRMQDPAYAAEVGWVKEQITACSCVCCHQGSRTPAGAAIWDTEFKGNFANNFTPWGLAFMGGFVKSSIFGSREPEKNNGFSRDVSGTPTTDIPRMVKFFEDELKYRGYDPGEFSDDDPPGGF